MFTLPDASDATATCPAFKPVGPIAGGFFQDCNPGANFPGTVPIADYFNELIVNLRALLVRAAVAGVKGDETMLWRAIEQRIHALDIPQQFFQIDTAVTLNVAPGGSPSPANPLGGDAFDTLTSAWHWLSSYTITTKGAVTIQLATATYTHSAPLYLNHPNGDRISIVGGDLNTTVLYFSGGTDGVVIQRSMLGTLSNVTILGTKAANSTGIHMNGGTVGIYAAIVRSWNVGVVVEGGGYLGFTALTVNDTLDNGLGCYQGGAANGHTLTCTSNGFGIGAPYYVAGLACTAGGTAWIDTVTCTSCHKGVVISGAGSELRVRALHVGAVDASGSYVSVEANSGGTILAFGGNPGDWTAAAPGYFYANYWGVIRADSSFDATSRSLASPGVNLLGNVNSMVTSL